MVNLSGKRYRTPPPSTLLLLPAVELLPFTAYEEPVGVNRQQRTQRKDPDVQD